MVIVVVIIIIFYYCRKILNDREDSSHAVARVGCCGRPLLSACRCSRVTNLLCMIVSDRGCQSVVPK